MLHIPAHKNTEHPGAIVPAALPANPATESAPPQPDDQADAVLEDAA